MARIARRLLLVLPVLAALIVVLAGCETPTLQTQSAQQQNLIGPVRVTTPIEGCENSGSGNTSCDGSNPLQLLVGYRVPEGTTAPAAVPSSAGITTTFHQSPTFVSELQRLVPAPSGQQWIAYISDEFTPPTTTSGPSTTTLAPDFNPPASLAGGNFTYRTLVGMRDDSVVTDPTRAVLCGVSDLSATGSNGDTCLTDPGTMADLTGGDVTVALNDLTLSPGAAPSVLPGDTATVPFVATLAGPALPGGSSFSLAAISGLPGATAAPGAASLAPSPGANAASATVKVPVTAAPGDYPLTLTATSGGQTRQATGSVHVSALPPINVSINRSLSVKNGIASLSLTCPSSNVDSCAGSVTLNTAGKVLVAKRKPKARRRALKLGSSTFSIAPGQTGTIAIKISALGRKALARTGKLRANATFTLKNRAGQAAKHVSHVTLVQAKARKKHHRK
jgi:hypothetical protein